MDDHFKNYTKGSVASVKCDAQNLKFKRAFASEKCMLSLIGELRHTLAESLFEEVIRLYKSGVKDLILDFRKLEYADTVGLQNLVRIYKYVDENDDISFSILAPAGEILNILQICRFDKFIDIRQDLSDFEDHWQDV